VSRRPRYLVNVTFDNGNHYAELGDVAVYASDEAEAERKALDTLSNELTTTVKGRIADDVPDNFYDRVIA